MRRTTLCAWLLGAIFLSGCAAPPPTLTLGASENPVDASLRGLCVVDRDVAWASGSDGTCLRTTDGGRSWRRIDVPGATDVDFRDVQARSADEALLMGVDRPARIYRTTDGGDHWSLVFTHDEDGVFLDAMDFWDGRRGIAFSDPVGGRLLVVVTEDAGATWQRVPPAILPPALAGEAGFAGSGTCLATSGRDAVWIGLGGATGTRARLVHSPDGGRTWTAVLTPLRSDAGAGVFSIEVGGDGRGVMVGGDYLDPDRATGHAALTSDAGRTWRAVTAAPPRGYRSAVARLPGTSVWVATGPSGIDVSVDDGETWTPLGEAGHHAVAFAPDGSVGWLSGAEGRLTRIEIARD